METASLWVATDFSILLLDSHVGFRVLKRREEVGVGIIVERGAPELSKIGLLAGKKLRENPDPSSDDHETKKSRSCALPESPLV
jgi:hypothetical protein